MDWVKASARVLCVAALLVATNKAPAEPTPRNNMDKPIHGPGPQRNGVDPQRQPPRHDDRPVEVYIPPPPLPPSPPVPYTVVAPPEARVSGYRGWRYVPSAPAGVTYPATVIYRYDTWQGGGAVLRTWRNHSHYNPDLTLVRPGETRGDWHRRHGWSRSSYSGYPRYTDDDFVCEDLSRSQQRCYEEGLALSAALARERQLATQAGVLAVPPPPVPPEDQGWTEPPDSISQHALSARPRHDVRPEIRRAASLAADGRYFDSIDTLRFTVNQEPEAFTGRIGNLFASDRDAEQKIRYAISIYQDRPRMRVSDVDGAFMVAALLAAIGEHDPAWEAARLARELGENRPSGKALYRVLARPTEVPGQSSPRAAPAANPTPANPPAAAPIPGAIP